MNEIDNATLPTLPAATVNGRARAAALAAHAGFNATSTSVIQFRSSGHLLIIGPKERALAAARALSERLHCVALINDRGASADSNTRNTDAGDGVTVAYGELERLHGHLGAFHAIVSVGGNAFDLASLFGGQGRHIDLVLDLCSPVFLQRDVVPLGYFAVGEDDALLERTLRELPDWVGDFQKPKFFAYDPDSCAHGGNGLEGCRRCLDACPTLAIRSLGEKVEIDPYLCQGGGSCAAACPSGAIRYVYPEVTDMLAALRAALKRYREAGGTHPYVLFYDAEHGAESLGRIVNRLPEHVLPFQVEEIGSVGLDTWLAALAYGANRVVLLPTANVPRSVLRELLLQVSYASAILEGLAYSKDLVHVLPCDVEAHVLEAFAGLEPGREIAPGTFAAFKEKRTTVRLAIEHLYAQASIKPEAADLPDGAPFGAIEVNRQACTLCMACVSVCPVSALYDSENGEEQPQLRFVESNCVQCGLCHTACPENAVRLLPRMAYESDLYRLPRLLHEEEPFCCVVCGKPFATHKMIERMSHKLAQHWMYQDPKSLRRLKMCDTCRVQDMLEQSGGLEVYEKSDSHH